MGRIKVVFLGTAELASEVLRCLSRAPFVELVAAVSQPDKPKGRQMKLEATPVKKAAMELGLPCWQPIRSRDPQFMSLIRQVKPDLIAVAAYGQILSGSLLDVPPMGCVNVHTSLLPKYRGAAPIQWALVNGETVTGVTIMKMDEGLDTGQIIAQERVPIEVKDTGQTLHDKLARLGGALLVKSLPAYSTGEIRPVPQNHSLATYARKITKQDGRIDWTRPAEEIRNKIRGFNPWPGTYSYVLLKDRATLIKIWEAEARPDHHPVASEVVHCGPEGIQVACGKGCLRILELQKEGSKRMTARDFLAGNDLDAGLRFFAGDA